MLSDNAYNYLRQQKRDSNYYVDSEKTIEYLLMQNFEVPNIIYDIQENYGGYKLEVSGKRSAGFAIQLISKKSINSNKHLRYEKEADKLYFSFGAHSTVQINFYISDEGIICAETDEIMNPISSSVEKYIENFALRDKICRAGLVNDCYYNVPDIKVLRDYLSKEYKRLNDCSDRYTIWYERQGLYVKTGVWLDKHEFYLTCYGRDEKIVNTFISVVAEKKLIKEPLNWK